VAEAPPVVLGDVREGLEQVDGRHDQVVEVEGVGLLQARLVQGVDLGQLPLGVVLGLRGEALVVDELVLEVADLVAHRTRREALRVEVEVAADERHEALAVGRVVDGEGAGEAELLGLGAQDAHAREWKVITHIARARPPTTAATRSRISAAALLVNVIARTSPGCTPRAASR
jgi:hypothetical protein